MSKPYPYAYAMAPRYDEAPEVTPQFILPEVHQPPSAPEVNAYNHNQYHQPVNAPYTPVKQDGSTLHTPATTAPYDQRWMAGAPQSEPGRSTKRATICGCSTAIFILSVIIAILSAAVVGLAAGTGIEASRASDAEAKLAAALASNTSSTSTSSSSSSSSTSKTFDSLDRNCSSNSASVTGSTYTSTFFNLATYTIYCNRDAPNTPLQSLFVGNFDDCMDACSSYTDFMTSNFPNATAASTTCAGVSFIPAWTNRTFAIEGKTPGNCYLKGGPQNRTALTDPNNGSETHAAIVTSS